MARPLYRFGNCELDPAARELTRHGESVALPPKAFDCIVYLVQHRDRAVGKDELISAVWGRADVSDAVMAQTLLRARRAINDTGERQSRIRTVPRFGYQWVGDIETVERAESKPMPASPPATPAAAPPDTPGFRAGPWLAILAIGLLVSVAWIAWQASTRPELDQPAPVADSGLAVVLPVTVNPPSPESAWVRLGAMDYIASRLRDSASLTVMPSERVLRLAGEIDVPGDGMLAERLREATGAGLIIQPFAESDETGWRMRLHLVTEIGDRDVEASGDSVLTAAAVASDMLLRRLGYEPPVTPVPTALTERLQQVDAELLAGQLATARALIQAATAEQREDPQLRVREGQLEFRAGRLDVAAALFETLLAQPESLDTGVRARALMGLGAVALRQREFDLSEQRYAEALQVLEVADGGQADSALMGNAWNGLGVSRVELGRLEEGIADLGRARIAMVRAGDEVEAASVSGNIGMLEARRGDLARAVQEYDRAARVFERFDVRDNLAVMHMARAASRLRLLQPAEALADSRRAMALSDGFENPRLLASIRNVHVRALIANGELDEAGSLLADDPEAPGELRLRLALELGDVTQAQALVQGLLASAVTLDGETAVLAVQAASRLGDAALTESVLARLPGPADDSAQGFDQLFARALAAAGRDMPDGDPALLLERALDTAFEARLPDEEVRAGAALVLYLVEQGRLERAAEVLGRFSPYAEQDYRAARAALALYQALGEASLAAQAEARVAMLAGERDLALLLTY